MRVSIIWYRYMRYEEAQIGRCFTDYDEAIKAAEKMAKELLDPDTVSVKNRIWTDADGSFVRVVVRELE